MTLLPQATAANVVVGPILDPNDGFYTAGVPSDFSVTSGGVATALAAPANSVTHLFNGMYLVGLTAANVASIGELSLAINKTGHVMTNHRYLVVTAAQFTALTNSGAVNVTRVGGTTVSGPNDLKADVSGLASQTSVDSIANRLPTTLDNGRIRAKVEAESIGLAKETTVNAVGQAVVTVADGVTALLNRIPQDIFTGITRLARWLGILAGKSTDAGTLAEIQATTGGATFNNVSDSLEAIRDRGDAAWVGGAGNGEYVLAITVSDGTNSVPNCRVSIVGSGLFGFTNTSGVASFNVSGSATYSVRVTPPVTFETPNDTSVAVAAQNVSQTIVVTAKPPVNPSAAPQCNVVLPVTDGAGSALTGAKVSIEFIRFESGATPSSVVIPPVPELTSAAGVVTVPLLRFGRYRATYSYQNGIKDFEFVVPDSGSATIVEQV